MTGVVLVVVGAVVLLLLAAASLVAAWRRPAGSSRRRPPLTFRQRIVVLAGLAIALAVAAVTLAPFDVGGSSCGSALTEQGQGPTSVFVPAGGLRPGTFEPVFPAHVNTIPNPCQSPAKGRLAYTLVLELGVGGLTTAAVFLLRTPRPALA